MLKKLLLPALLALTFNAYASDREQSNGNVTNIGVATTSQSIAGAVALSSSTVYAGGGSATTGNNNISVDNGNDRIIPVSSAIAPSVMQNTVCPIISPSSKAASILIFSASGTTGTTLNAICVAWNLKQLDVVERMACKADKAYREANPNCQQGDK